MHARGVVELERSPAVRWTEHDQIRQIEKALFQLVDTRPAPAGGETWAYARSLHSGPSAYSDLVVCRDGSIGTSPCAHISIRRS
jgi:hypothetical protein